MEKKITLREQFVELRALAETAGRADLVAFVDGRIEQLNKKSASRGTAKVSDEDKILIDAITKVLADGKARTCSELIKADTALNGLSTQKVRGILNKVPGMVSTKDGKRTVFSIVTPTATPTDTDTPTDKVAE